MGFVLFLVSIFVSSSFACTVFNTSQSKGSIVGKSYDWENAHGYVLVNKRHLKKTALNIFPNEKPASWTSKYGSLTYNQHGLEFPLSGINEKGLVVEILWLDETVYPKQDSRPSINELQWVQYQLDNFASVPEMLLAVEKIRLRNVSAAVHYMVCDVMKDCATIEFLKGKTVVHKGQTLPYQALTNDTYDRSVAFLKKHTGFGGNETIDPASTLSLHRFVRAVAQIPDTQSVEGVFKVLASVKSPPPDESPTVWNMAHEPLARVSHFRTTQLPSIRTVQMDKFDLSCKSPAQMLDMEQNLSGDVSTRFISFNNENNSEMVRKSLPGLIQGILATKIEAYPGSVTCTE